MSHALFKAALFLAAGAIIHTSHSRFMYHMGGLKKHMPITFWSTTLAAFSLMGVPIIFSGFWSKDLILEASLTSGNLILFSIAAISVSITAFYAVRMIALAFLGKKSRHLKSLEDQGTRLHEASPIMWVPFTILTGLTILFGLQGSFVKNFLEEHFGNFLGNIINIEAAHSSVTHTPSNLWIVPFISVIMLLVGAAPAYILYIRRSVDPTKIVGESGLKAVWNFIYNRLYINRFYYKVFINSFTGLGNWLLNVFEAKGVDRFNYIIVEIAQRFCTWFRKSHTGLLTYNLLGLTAGLVLLIIIMLSAVLR
jgi:NADH-quinone oxidoreductase subunit L